MKKIINTGKLTNQERDLLFANLTAVTDAYLATIVGHPTDDLFVAVVREKAKRAGTSAWADPFYCGACEELRQRHGEANSIPCGK